MRNILSPLPYVRIFHMNRELCMDSMYMFHFLSSPYVRKIFSISHSFLSVKYFSPSPYGISLMRENMSCLLTRRDSHIGEVGWHKHTPSCSHSQAIAISGSWSLHDSLCRTNLWPFFWSEKVYWRSQVL